VCWLTLTLRKYLEYFYLILRTKYPWKPVLLSFIRTLFDQNRLCLSAMHYNENADRLQAVTVNGQHCYSIRFPKAKKGAHSVRAEKTRATYSKL